MPFLNVNGYTKYYEMDDFTPPWLSPVTIFIQHGMCRNLHFWRHRRPVLALSYRVIRHDLPGHGDSQDPGPDYPWTMETVVDDIVALLDDLKIQRVHFLGESTSGMLGIIFAVRYPERLQSLTLCASPLTIGPEAQKMFAFGHKDWQTAIRTLGTYGWGKKLAAMSGTMGNLAPEQQEWVLNQIGKIPVRALVDYSLMASRTDVEPLLKDIRVPVLILAPTRSAATPMAQQVKMQQAIPDARLVVIDGVAHEIYRDRAEDCMNTLLDFLHSVENG
jgi:pimeloyl-ACP methyl ester carboxylesterase